MLLARSLVRAMEERKAEEIVLLDVQGRCPFADYFVLCSGSSERMLRALTETVVEAAHKEFKIAAKLEGHPESGWVLVDLGTVIAHIFTPQRREYYGLEKLWQDGKVVVRIQ